MRDDARVRNDFIMLIQDNNDTSVKDKVHYIDIACWSHGVEGIYTCTRNTHTGIIQGIWAEV